AASPLARRRFARDCCWAECRCAFPSCFGFLEGGVAWAVMCYCDLISHWHKRNGKAMREVLDPALVDEKLFASLFERYAQRLTEGASAKVLASQGFAPLNDMPIDEFEKSGIRSAEDIRKIFV